MPRRSPDRIPDTSARSSRSGTCSISRPKGGRLTGTSSSATPERYSAAEAAALPTAGAGAQACEGDKLGQVELQHPDRVAAHDLLDLLLVQVLHLPLGDFFAVRPGGVAVRVVGLERDRVDAHVLERAQAVRVVGEA